jgi:hypothetical protein
MEPKKINKDALKGENGRHLEYKYLDNKRLFFIENGNATEQDFIESEIEKINKKEKDNERMWNLSDADFFQEYRKDDVITKKTNWNIDEAENKKQILRNYRNLYKPSEFENPLLTLYKQKLNYLSNFKTPKSDVEIKLSWQGTDLQFAELSKALKESNLVSPELSQKELFKRLKLVFNVNDFNESDKLKEVRKRTKDLTPTINILETGLINWINKND